MYYYTCIINLSLVPLFFIVTQVKKKEEGKQPKKRVADESGKNKNQGHRSNRWSKKTGDELFPIKGKKTARKRHSRSCPSVGSCSWFVVSHHVSDSGGDDDSPADGYKLLPAFPPDEYTLPTTAASCPRRQNPDCAGCDHYTGEKQNGY